MARVLDFHSHIVQMGIRSQCREEREKTEVLRTPVIYAHQILTAPHGEESWIKRVIGACRKRVYVTFDCDVFDPAVIPATGTPEPGGLNWQHVDGLFRRLCNVRDVVGLDILLGAHSRHPSPAVQPRKPLYRFLGIRFQDVRG